MRKKYFIWVEKKPSVLSLHISCPININFMIMCLCVSIIKIINRVYNCAPIAFILFIYKEYKKNSSLNSDELPVQIMYNTSFPFWNKDTHQAQQGGWLLLQVTTCVTKIVTSFADHFICGAVLSSWQLLYVLVSTPVEKKWKIFKYLK